ncbi:unnamed protein product, partial [Rotaria sp. Silwood2]
QGQGNGLTLLSCPQRVVVDQLGTVYVADGGNDRIMRWPKGATQGSVIVGGNGSGEQSNQFNWSIAHYILINKDYFDKITKQLPNPDSQVSFISPIIPMPQSSPSTVMTVSEPQFRLSDFKLSTFQSLSPMLQINSNMALFRYHLHVSSCK